MAHQIKAINSSELFIGAGKVIGGSSLEESKLSVLLDIRDDLRTAVRALCVIGTLLMGLGFLVIALATHAL